MKIVTMATSKIPGITGYPSVTFLLKGRIGIIDKIVKNIA
jgi:hypothetical protein